MSHLNVIFAYSDGSLKALTTSNGGCIFICFHKDCLNQTPKASQLNHITACTHTHMHKKRCKINLCLSMQNSHFSHSDRNFYKSNVSCKLWVSAICDNVLIKELVVWPLTIPCIVSDENQSLTDLDIVSVTACHHWSPVVWGSFLKIQLFFFLQKMLCMDYAKCLLNLSGGKLICAYISV